MPTESGSGRADDAGKPATQGPETPRRLQDLVLDQLGQDICNGQLHSGEVLRSDALEERYNVSRSVIREALSVLASIGMVESRRRVGVTMLPPSEWNLFDPRIIRWRLASSGRMAQLRSLTELRTAVESQSALLAATRASLVDASNLVGLAARMWAAGHAGEAEDFLKLDIEFHQLVLACSGNEMFAKLGSLVAEVLTGRTQYGLMPHQPSEEAMLLHAEVARAIQRSKPDEAHLAMLRIMQQAMEEMSSLWEQETSGQVSPEIS